MGYKLGAVMDEFEYCTEKLHNDVFQKARAKAIEEGNADILYTLKEAFETEKFMVVDVANYEELIDKLNEYIK